MRTRPPGSGMLWLWVVLPFTATMTRVAAAFSALSSIDAGQVVHPWPSSLPLPQYCDTTEQAQRARRAMTGIHPAALQGRCPVDMTTSELLRFVHVDPPVLVMDHFLTAAECTQLLQCTTHQPPADAGRIIQLHSQTFHDSNKISNRQSTTWYIRYGCTAVAPLLRGISQLLPGVALEQVEEVQLVRYAGSTQGFGWHEDALTVDQATVEAGGQRVATCLVYLTDCKDGGGRTIFRDLVGDSNRRRLAITPRVGRAVLFFPATTGHTTHVGDTAAEHNTPQPTLGDVYYDHTRADHRTVHAGEPPGGEKHIAQLWIHSGHHTPVVFGKGLNRHAEANL